MVKVVYYNKARVKKSLFTVYIGKTISTIYANNREPTLFGVYKISSSQIDSFFWLMRLEP